MKNKFIIGIAAASILSLGFLAGCNRGDNPGDVEYSFTLALATGKTTLILDDTDTVQIKTTGDASGKSYTLTSSDKNVLTIDANNGVKAVGVGQAIIMGKESTTGLTASLRITVIEASGTASGGYNYASLAGAEAIQTRTEILAKLEKYSMEHHLTGITLFENGGYVKYSSRLTIPASEYITGYGFGLLSEGDINADMENEENKEYKRYLHSASSSDPLTINEKNDDGSQVSDLAGYITSSYWSTKLNSTKDGYEWYPLLAKDSITVNGGSQKFDRPLPVYEGDVVYPGETDPNPLGLYKTWRIYVKTGTDGELKYRTMSTARSSFDQTGVTIADYEFAYRFLLTGSHKQVRGTQMAADLTYGYKGAQAFNERSKNLNDTDAKNLWNNMKEDGSLGIQTGHDDVNGDYLELTILNPIDRFTAMYTLSSSLVSPLPEAFIEAIGDGSVSAGAKKYGNFNSGGNDAILDYTICVGPYMLQEWKKNQTIVFKKNDKWFETNRYNIKGVKIVVYESATTDTDALYKAFNHGDLDSCGIPSKHLEEEIGQPGVRQTKGDSTFKLNVNSCNEAEWNKLFGPNGTINKNSSWELKPWMSNDHFLNGLFYSINRKEFATARGVQPSINYFSDAYLSDPENGVSYNSTTAHEEAVKGFQTKDVDGNDTYGFSYDKAVLEFKAAVKELLATGAVKKGRDTDHPTIINIHIRWMYQTDVAEYGDQIKQYFESAFNDNEVSQGLIKLEVLQEAVTDWQDVYYEYLMKGQFDLGFGAISGNTYNPLNFLEVLKSDNSSSFTLNWGTDTSKVSENKPLVYDHKLWSFDALWEVADHGGVVENGEKVKSVKNCYMEFPTDPETHAQTDKIYNGVDIEIPIEFVNVDDVEFDISRVQLYIVGSGNEDLAYTVNADKTKITVKISKAQGDAFNTKIRQVNKLTDDDPKPVEYPFIKDNYGIYWTIEVYYTISIKQGSPSESYVTVAGSKGQQQQ